MTFNLTSIGALLLAFTLGLVLHPVIRSVVRDLNMKHKSRRFDRAVKTVEAAGYSVDLIVVPSTDTPVEDTDLTQDLYWANRPSSPADWLTDSSQQIADSDRITWQNA
jgi:hypothetical protein